MPCHRRRARQVGGCQQAQLRRLHPQVAGGRCCPSTHPRRKPADRGRPPARQRSWRHTRRQAVLPVRSRRTVVDVTVSTNGRRALWAVAIVAFLVCFVVAPGPRVTPRFDTPAQAVLNVCGICLWVTMAVLMWRRSRRGAPMSNWDWVALIGSGSCFGVYVPVLPICWFVGRYRATGQSTSGEPADPL